VQSDGKVSIQTLPPSTPPHSASEESDSNRPYSANNPYAKKQRETIQQRRDAWQKGRSFKMAGRSLMAVSKFGEPGQTPASYYENAGSLLYSQLMIHLFTLLGRRLPRAASGIAVTSSWVSCRLGFRWIALLEVHVYTPTGS
jgi:hypothetical protein